jgi:hypothetical protein
MATTTAKAMIFSMSTLDHSLDLRSNWVPVSKDFNSAFASGIGRRQESLHALAPIGWAMTAGKFRTHRRAS